MVSPLNLWVWLGWLAWLCCAFPLLADVEIEPEILSTIMWYAVTFAGWVISYAGFSYILGKAPKSVDTVSE